MKNNLKGTFLLVFGIGFVCIAPLIFTMPHFFSFSDFSSTGQIGDTIGGITAPVVGLIGAILVYLSFKAQIDANAEQRKQFNLELARSTNEKRYNSILHDIEILRDEIKEFTYLKEQGIKAIQSYTHYIEGFADYEDLSGEFKNNFSSQFYFLIGNVDNILQVIRNSKLDSLDEIILYRKTIFIYTSKLLTPMLIIKAKYIKLKPVDERNEMIEMFIETQDRINELMKKYYI